MTLDTMEPEKRAKVVGISKAINAELAKPAARPLAPVPGVGIHPGVSFGDYHRWDAVSHHMLEGYKRTPAHARELMLHPKDPTEALALGHAFHTLLLEPDRFEAEYVESPRDAPARRSNADKAWWAEFEIAHKGQTILSSDEMEAFKRMAQAVGDHPVARELLSRGASELSFAWEDDETGLLCKGRMDHVGQIASDTFIADVKTAIDASEREFQKAVARFGYGRQVSWYRQGLDVLKPHPRRACFIVVEKTPPFCIAMYELDERALEQGEREWRSHLRTHKRCLETGIYPGYDAGLGLIDLPAWAVDHMDLGS